VAIINRGRLVALGSPSELAGASRGLTFSVERPIDTAALASSLAVDVNETRNGYRVDGVEPNPALISRLTAWLAENNVRLQRLDVGTRSLEDVYLELTK
jgi:ABC-2 type transport system ATP-binding protein